MDTRDPASTVLFLDSCAKEVTSPTTTELVESVCIFVKRSSLFE